MFTLLFALLLLWLFFKLGIGFIKLTIFIIGIVITALFFAYLLIPVLVVFGIGYGLWAFVTR